MHCVILAGGLATRVLPLTALTPKTLLPVNGEPFAAHQLAYLSEQGVTDVVYCIGHFGSMIRAFVGDGSRWGIRVRYVDEGETLRGTAGALRLALDAGALPEQFFVLYGDSYLPIDMRSVWEAHAALARPVLMTILKNCSQWDRSNVHFSEQSGVRYDPSGVLPSGERMQWIDYGLLVLRRSVLEASVPVEEVIGLPEVLRSLSVSGQVSGFEVRQRFYEIGSHQGLIELEHYLGGEALGREGAAGPIHTPIARRPSA